MFKTLRHKLLFWFLLFLSTNFIIIFINLSYLNEREKIAEVLRLLDETHGLLLEDYKNQLNFFTQETKNRVFFEFGTSPFIDHHKTLFVQINQDLDLIGDHEFVEEYGLKSEFTELGTHLKLYDSIFFELVDYVQERGFKDYNIIGQMRKAAHHLESDNALDQLELLELRRNEKDYLLRHDNIYLRRHNRIATRIKRAVFRNQSLSKNKRLELITSIDDYLNNFRVLVTIDRQIGLFDNSGIKRALDEQENIMAQEFVNLLNLANQAKEEQFSDLKRTTAIITVLFIIFGILSSILISRKITIPLTDLTTYITRFVQSEFTFTEAKHSKVGRDEIGKLTLNFNVMRDKIIDQLQFFKQKVEERTLELADANDRLVQLNKANQRFVPNEFLHYLKKESIEEVRLGDNIEQDMTIMFSDIRGFTKFSEKMTPQENFDFINAYLKEIVPQVREHEGFVDKYIGDSVMALFANDVEKAINSAIDSHKCVRRFNKERKKDGKEAIGVGIGIHSGRLILGTIGEPERMETTVISDAVNTASRIEGLTAVYGASIIVSQAVFDKIKDVNQYDYRFVDSVKVKGKEQAIEVYEILDGLEEAKHELKLKTKAKFSEGIFCFMRQEFKDAQKLFKAVQKIDPDDTAASRYLDRCEDLLSNGIPENWTYTKKMEFKK